MPRQLKEIKRFNTGTILNASERDIPQDSPTYSLNINPMSEGGILSAIKNDKLIGSVGEVISTFLTPVTWNTIGNSLVSEPTPKEIGHYKSRIKDVNIFENEASPLISFIGTKGKKETLNVMYIEPCLEKLYDVTTNHYTFTPTSASTEISSTIYCYTNTNAITGTADAGNTTITGFDNGIATIQVDTDDPSTLADRTIIIRTPDGRNISYKIKNSAGTTGDTAGGFTQIFCPTAGSHDTDDEIAEEIKTGIEHANGHNWRINITRDDDKLTLTYNTVSLSSRLNKGDYISFVQTNDTYTGRDEFEIMQVISTSSESFEVKRNCFGTQSFPNLSTSNEYHIYANRLTLGTSTATNQYHSTAGTCKLYNWSGNSGNNLNGNASYLTKTSNSTGREKCGKILTGGTNKAVVFDATNKTITLGVGAGVGDGDVLFNEGDVITTYQTTESPNNGKSFKILKKTTDPPVFTLDKAPTDRTESTAELYIEANLIKNHTFHHIVSDGTITPAANGSYKCNDWLHQSQGLEGGEGSYIDNVYEADTSNKVVIEASGGVWDDANPLYGESTAGTETKYYPFGGSDNNNDAHIKLISEFIQIRVSKAVAISATDTTIQFKADVSNLLASNDIICFEAVGAGGIDGNTEYMQVKGVSSNIITVNRGYLGTTPIAHSITGDSGDQPFKCKNHSIKQDIPKDRLKPGQSYTFSFFAQDNIAIGSAHTSRLNFAVSANGGYFQTSGIWTEFSRSNKIGYISSSTNNFSELTKEDRWISLNALYPSSYPILTDVWNRFSFTFTIPKNIELKTDLTIELASRGKDASSIYIDLTDLNEETLVTKDSLYSSSLYPISKFINHGDRKDLIMIDAFGGSFSVINSFSVNNSISSNISTSDIIKGGFSTPAMQSSSGVSLISRNRSIYAGFGSQLDDSPPQWLGYLNHKVFGFDYTNSLYQDSASVQSFSSYDANNSNGENTTNSIDKICVAGEFEYLSATWDNGGDKDLTITHANHKITEGDNIVVREYGDVSNEWTGAGVWVVTNIVNSSSFECKRYNIKDPDPDNLNFMQADGNRDGNTGKISYRPYFYYGIKAGKPYVYRIWPDSRIKTDVANLDPVYYAGRIEQSPDLGYNINSITTCYAKEESAGTPALNGGCVYILPYIDNNNTPKQEVFIYDIMRGAQTWQVSPPNKKGTLNLVFKSFKWSNDDVSGDIGGDTAVFDSLASVSTPTIPWGNSDYGRTDTLTDILETKAPNEKYVYEVTTNVTNEPDHFDTRLWIQASPGDNHLDHSSDYYRGFKMDSKFLFCGRTTESIMGDQYNADFSLGDRTPDVKSFGNRAHGAYAGSVDSVVHDYRDYLGEGFIHSPGGDVAGSTFIWGIAFANIFFDSGHDYQVPGNSYFLGGPQMNHMLFSMRATQFVDMMHDTGGDGLASTGPAGGSYGGYSSSSEYLSNNGWGLTISKIKPMTDYFYGDYPPSNYDASSHVTFQNLGNPNGPWIEDMNSIDYVNDNTNYYSATEPNEWQSGTRKYTSYINFGNNVGWQDYISFIPPRFGLTQVSDNDRDGLIDGTGLVVPSTTSLDKDIGNRHTGTYGEYHRRVCGHVVALPLKTVFDTWMMTSQSQNNNLIVGDYILNNGRMGCYGQPYFHSSLPEDGDFDISTGSDYLKMSPYNVDTPYYTGKNKAYLAICPDIHYGDYEMPPQLVAHASASEARNFADGGSGDYTKVELASGNSTSTLQAGDPIWIADDSTGAGVTAGDYTSTNYGATYISKILDDTHLLVPVAYNATINNAKLYPMTPALGYDYVDQVDMVDNLYNTGCISKFPAFHNSYLPSKPLWGPAFTSNHVVVYDAATLPSVSDSPNNTTIVEWDANTFYAITDADRHNHLNLGNHWYTTPTRFGATGAFGQKVAGEPDGRGFVPGIISRIENLNFKSGRLIRPFNGDIYPMFGYDEFGSLDFDIRSLTVDIPSFPEVIYHKKQGSNLSSSINNNEANNQFASKLYMMHSASTQDVDGIWINSGMTSFYSFDLNLMLPNNKILQAPWLKTKDSYNLNPLTEDDIINSDNLALAGLENSGLTTSTTNHYSAGEVNELAFTSHLYGNYNNYMLMGYLTVDNSYITTADVNYPAADKQPIVVISGSNGSVYNRAVVSTGLSSDSTETDHDFWGVHSQWRDRGAFSGMMLSILDKETGCIQTSQIVDSKSLPGGSPARTDSVYLMFHYPFGHSPSKNDYYYIWAPWLANLSPVRLAKQQLFPAISNSGDFLAETTANFESNFPPSIYAKDPLASLPIKKGFSFAKDTGGTDTSIGWSESDKTLNQCSVADTGVVTCLKQHGLTTNDKVLISDEADTTSGQTFTITVTGPLEFTIAFTTAITTAFWSEYVGLTGTTSMSNPMTLNVDKAHGKTMFGGFDMRKLRKYAITLIADDTNDIRLTSTAHKLFNGDTITFKSEMITAEVNRLINGTSAWAEYHVGGSATSFDSDGSSGPEYIAITQAADANTQGTQLGAGGTETFVADRTYRVTAEMWCASGTLSGVTMKIHGTVASETHTITTEKRFYTSDIVANGDGTVYIYSATNLAVAWYVDNITIEDINQNAIYNVKDSDDDGDVFDVENKEHISLIGTAYTNYWESFIVESAGQARVSSVRDSLNSWDRGASSYNAFRNDIATALDGNVYMSVIPNNTSVTAGGEPATGAFVFESGVNYQYKVSYIYDGYQEGALSGLIGNIEPSTNLGSVDINLSISNYSLRLTHVCLYRRNSELDFYRLVKEISTDSGWSMVDGSWNTLVQDTGKLGATYESRTGLSEVLTTTSIKYGLSEEIDGYLIVGDCAHTKIKNASTMLFRSKPGRFSIFDWATDFVILKSKPTALTNFNGRLYAFDSNNIYRINSETLIIEDIFEGIGCLNKYSVLTTEYGMFFVDITGVYLHDGNTPTKISEPISQSGEVDTDFYSLLGGDDNIVDASWKNIVNQKYFSPPSLIFEASTSSILIIFKLVSKSNADKVSKVKYFTWSYNIPQSRWDLWELCEEQSVGKPFLGQNGSVCLFIGNLMYEYKGGSSYRDYTWVSKKITMEEDSIFKVFNKVKLNGISDNVNLDGTNDNSQNKLLLVTSSGAISNSDLTYNSSSSQDSEYKISSSNKKGRWIQIKLENMEKELDSIGVLYRRKSTK